MKSYRFIVIILATLVLVGCGIKKGVQDKVQTPTWHTCLVQGARGTVITDDNRISATLTMQVVHDSMLVISAMPLLGLEMARLEATPTQLIAIDKIHGQYATATYAELNRKLTPSINWDILQQLCSAELPTGAEKARLLYMFDDKTIEVIVNYVPRQTDVPVRVLNQRLDKYQKVDISKWL